MAREYYKKVETKRKYTKRIKHKQNKISKLTNF